MKDYIDEIKKYLDFKNLWYDEEIIQKLDSYIHAVFEQNKVMNLTAAKTLEEIAIRHCLDSLTICDVVTFEQNDQVLDLGTGAGFPGVPLAIIYPNIQFTLIDSVKKKLDFIQRTCKRLNINNVITYHGRIESFGHDTVFREKFDYVCARALAPLPVLLEYCIPFLKLSGCLISFKGKNVENEIKEAQRALYVLNSKIIKQQTVKVSNQERVNHFILIQKLKNTLQKYPRKAGIPKKDPL